VYLLLDNVSESCDMQNRSTILLLLFTVTLAVGALTLWQSSNDNEAVERFRSLFSTSAVYDLQHSLPSVTDQASLLYGGIALLAIIVIVLALRAAWRDSSRSPKNG
jgi:ABC-type phosphate transport system permease subunit